MASQAAQAYFNSMSPADQQAIRDSWGGKDMMDQWYNAAKGAGAVPATTQAGSPFEANLNVFNANQDFKDTNISQGQWDAWTAEERAKASGANANNTANKYNPTGTGGCPPNLPYTSRPGPNGQVECAAKPDDCPEGSHVEGTPGRCVQNGTGHEAPGAFGGGTPAAGAGASTGAGAAYFGQDDPLQRYLTGLLSTGGGTFAGAGTGGQLQGGGVFWQGNQPQANPANAPAPAAPAPAAVAPAAAPAATSALVAPAAPSTTDFDNFYEPWKAAGRPGTLEGFAGQQGAATGLLAAPAAPQVTAQPVTTTPANPWGTVTGAPLGGLEGLVDPRARRRDARSTASWF